VVKINEFSSSLVWYWLIRNFFKKLLFLTQTVAERLFFTCGHISQNWTLQD